MVAEQLKQFHFAHTTEGKSRWAEFLDGNIWKLSLEETGAASVESLRSSLRSAAFGQGLTIRTSKVDESTLVVQSLGN